jgi:hypothetical protein
VARLGFLLLAVPLDLVEEAGLVRFDLGDQPATGRLGKLEGFF